MPQGILIGLGYNVSIADEGARYSEKERRHACHSSLKDFTTTLTETQGGTGGNLYNFDNWDGRLPDEIDARNNEEPSWAQEDPTGGQSAHGGTTSQSGSQ